MNLINVLLAVASALQVMLGISVRLTLVSMVVFPLVMLTTRLFSSRMFARTQLEKEEFSILMGIIKQINLFKKSKVD